AVGRGFDSRLPLQRMKKGLQRAEAIRAGKDCGRKDGRDWAAELGAAAHSGSEWGRKVLWQAAELRGKASRARKDCRARRAGKGGRRTREIRQNCQTAV